MDGDQLPDGGLPSIDWAEMAGRAADSHSLTALADLTPSTMDGPALVDAIVASEKALSLLTAVQMRLLAALAEPFVAGDPLRLAARLARKNCIAGDDVADNVQMFVPDAAASLAASEVAAALRISPVTAGIRVREAGVMTSELSPTLEAMEDGVLDRGKARVISEQCEPLSSEHTAEVQRLVLAQAARLTTSELRDITGQAVITVDPDGADERHRAAAARRDLALSALPDAMASLRAFLPADGAVKIFQVSDLLAAGTAGNAGDARGIGARRVDALVDIADQLLTYGYLDLGHYLGRQLPDHGKPVRRDRRHPGAEDQGDAESHTAPGTPDVDSHPHRTRPKAASSEVATPQTEAAAEPAEPHHAPADAAAPDPAAPEPAKPHHAPADAAAPDPAAPEPMNGADHHTPGAEVAPPETDSARDDRSGPGFVNSNHSSGSNSEPPPVGSGADVGTSAGSARVFARQGRRPHLSLTMGLGTLAGLDRLPGLLAGFGAIPPDLALSIAKSAGSLTSLVIDPATGAVTDAGELVYRPRQNLRDQAAALLNTCQFPSCRQPSWRCDIDHREPFDHENPEQGGRTSRDNVGPLCRRHHLFKHHSEWQLRPDPDRFTLHWTSPTGHRYVKRARQTAPPEHWLGTVTTATTMVADRLDAITPVIDDVRQFSEVNGVEDLLAALLLRHQTRQPPMEYHADPADWEALGEDPDGESAEDADRRASGAEQEHIPEDGQPSDRDQGTDDAPPF